MKSKRKILFVVCLSLIALIALFFDDYLEHHIEHTGSLLIKAQIDVGEVDIHFFPPRLELYKIRAANPLNPSRNIVVIPQLTATFDAQSLWDFTNTGNLVINHVHIADISFDQPRRKSGAINGLTPTNQNPYLTSPQNTPNLTLSHTTIEEQLSARLAAYQTAIEPIREFATLSANQFNQNTLTRFNKRWNHIQTQHTDNKFNELRQLKKEMTHALHSLSTLQQQTSEKLHQINSIAISLESIHSDNKTVQNEFNLAIKSIASTLSQSLITQQINALTHSAVTFYTDFIRDSTTIPFSIKTLTLNGTLVIGNSNIPLTGQLDNLSSTQIHLKQPCTVSISSAADYPGSLTLSGKFISGNDGEIQLNINNLATNALTLAESPIARTIASYAKITAHGMVTLAPNHIAITLETHLNNAQITLETNVTGSSNINNNDALLNNASDYLRTIDRLLIYTTLDNATHTPAIISKSSIDDALYSLVSARLQAHYLTAQQTALQNTAPARNTLLTEMKNLRDLLYQRSESLSTQIKALENLMLIL